MGQEWAASTPFIFFTDHNEELGRAVTEGRRREFASFEAFSKITIPDPQSLETFQLSKLRWDETTTELHLYMLNLYRSLLQLRRDQTDHNWTAPDLPIESLDENTLLLTRKNIHAVIRLHGQGEIALPSRIKLGEAIWNSEDPRFVPDSRTIQFNSTDLQVSFLRPGAIVFRAKEEQNA
jgi:maltooligosyltrehalose trehalohydrolase